MPQSLNPHSETAVETALAYARQNGAAFLDQLCDFLRIPSVSTQPQHTPDIWRAAEWLADNLRRAGLEHCAVLPTAGHPVVYADWLHAPGAPTVLFYGHYDVQPADEVELWKSPPFEPEVRNNSLYARGASDDKGQVMIVAKAVEAHLQATGTLPVNVKFLIEGEEESGSAAVQAFITANAALLSADAAYIADTAMIDFDTPSIVYGLRGIVSINIDVSGPRLDLHSGSYGGAINNPLHALVHMLAALKDADGRILIPGFYDKVRPLDAAERQRLAEQTADEANWLAWTGAPAAWGEPEFSRVERTGARPTLEINGLVGGYTGDGSKTIIPSKAHAKLSLRLVPDQDPGEIVALVEGYLNQIAPPSVQIKTTVLGMAPAVISEPDNAAMRAAVQACTQQFGRSPVFQRGGGSIPVVGDMQHVLRAQTVLLGFGLPHDRIHAPNERFHLPNFYNGIETVIRFLANYGAPEDGASEDGASATA